MKLDNNDLESRAARTIEIITEEFTSKLLFHITKAENGIFEKTTGRNKKFNYYDFNPDFNPINYNYRRAPMHMMFIDALAEIGLKPTEVKRLKGKFLIGVRNFNYDEFMRISFETICYAIFLIIVKHSHNPVRTNGFQTFKLEPEQVTFYNNKLVKLLDEFFKKTGYSEMYEQLCIGINEHDLEFGDGEPSIADYRLKQYQDIYTKKGMREVKICYTLQLGGAIKPINHVVPLYVLYHAEYLDGYLEKLLPSIFQ